MHIGSFLFHLESALALITLLIAQFKTASGVKIFVGPDLDTPLVAKAILTNSPWQFRSYIFSILALEYYVRFFFQDIWHSVFCYGTRDPTQQSHCKHHRSASRSSRSEESDICIDHTVPASCRFKSPVHAIRGNVLTI